MIHLQSDQNLLASVQMNLFHKTAIKRRSDIVLSYHWDINQFNEVYFNSSLVITSNSEIISSKLLFLKFAVIRIP